MTDLYVAGILNGSDGADIFALLATLSFVGVLCAVLTCFSSFLILRNSYHVSAILCVGIFSCLIAVIYLWISIGCKRLGISLGADYPGSFLVISGQRLEIILLMTVSTAFAVVLAFFKRQLFSRLFLSGLFCAWSISIWIALLNNGLLRACACSLLGVLFFIVLQDASMDMRVARKVFFLTAPLVAVCSLWCVAEITGSFVSELRFCVILFFLFLVPLPGYLSLWKEGAFPGIFMVLVFGPLCGFLIFEPGIQVEWPVILSILCALVAGIGAAVSNHLRGFIFFVCAAFLHQNTVFLFSGDGKEAFRFISFYPFIAFGLFLLAFANKSEEVDFRFMRKIHLPVWLKGVVFFFLIATFSGLVPGDQISLRLKLLSRIQSLGFGSALFVSLFLAGDFFILLGVLRFLNLFSSGSGKKSPGISSIPMGVWLGLCFLFMAAMNPLYLVQLFGIQNNNPAIGPSAPWLLFMPVAGAFIVFAATPRQEPVTRIWSGVSPKVEGTLCAFTSPVCIFDIIGILGRLFCFLDGLAYHAIGIAWKVLWYAGRILRACEWDFGIIFVCLLFWGRTVL